MKTPSADDLFLAVQWLDVYEGAEDAEACKRVAKWLNEKADAKELQETCKAAGIPVAVARKAISQKSIG